MDAFLDPNGNEGHVPIIQQDEVRLVFLKRAAEDGYVPAMRRLATECLDLHERRRWLRRAAEKEQPPVNPFTHAGESHPWPRRLPRWANRRRTHCVAAKD